MKRIGILVLVGGLFGLPSWAQSTGTLSGTVTLGDGSAVPGVRVEASSSVLPQLRAATTNANGEYRLPLLPPGDYQVTFTLSGMAPQTRAAQVLLQVNTTLDATLAPEAITETIEVVGDAAVIDSTSAELKTSISKEVIDPLPVGQEFRDLMKLIPGVQYTEDNVRGPSAGGSGQDNAYQFDGVNVALPLFGTLSAEPSSHDIDQVAIIKGGAKAVDFNRAGGFTMNSISKSGTNDFRGEVSYQLQSADMTGDRDIVSASTFEEDKDWSVLSLGGRVVPDRMYFYGSYYRPTVTRDNRANAYGEVPDFESTRDEFFGKLSFQPTESILLHASYRDSDRSGENEGVGGFTAASAATSSEATLGIAILEGSWVVNDSSFVSVRYTDFENETGSSPDDLLGFSPTVGQRLDVANLDRQGLFNVPTPIAGNTAFNDFVNPLIQRYGFLVNGARTGGGAVGAGTTINNQDFFRQSAQAGYDLYLGDDVSHTVHFGYQWSVDEEDLSRLSNGWGSIAVPRVPTFFNGQQVFFQATLEQQSLVTPSGVVVPVLHSEFESHSIEINDTIQIDDWSFNVGLMASNDILYGQGLRENSSNLSGFELAAGNKYKMYEIDFEDTLSPRLGATWAYDGSNTVYANYARYYPAASSLPRAASWDRNIARTIRANFAADGTFIGVDPVASSSGKFFDDDLDPRSIDEYLIGTSRQFGAWTTRAHARYRYGANFWEDTNNDARLIFGAPDDVAHELYIPNLADVRREIGGSSYVIAELDGAFTKYYEANLEAEWRGTKAFFRGSYVWSHYYGNFDQDSTTVDNDQAIFVGSSNLSDGAGRQLWDFKYGDLRGDRRHQFKAYGFYTLPWNASAGAFAVYQSGQPWEIHDARVYAAFNPGTSDTNRYAEPAGSRTSDSHWQIDLNYTQDFEFGGRYNLQLRADVFNVLDEQTGYDIETRASAAGVGTARRAFDPRRFQLAVKFMF